MEAYLAASPTEPDGRPETVPKLESVPEAPTSNMVIELESPLRAYKKWELLFNAMSEGLVPVLPVTPFELSMVITPSLLILYPEILALPVLEV